jgi:hypothetical protein
VQSVILFDFMAEYDLAGQGVQETLPIESLYVPSAHAVHICPETYFEADKSGPVHPGMHIHVVAPTDCDPLPAADTEIEPMLNPGQFSTHRAQSG